MTQTAATYFPLDRTVIVLTGTDRVSFLNNLATNDIKRLAFGEGCETFFTNVQGKILAHAFVLAQTDAVEVNTVSDESETLLSHFEKYHIREDLNLTDKSSESRHVALGAAASKRFCQRHELEMPVDEIRHATIKMGETPVRWCSVPMLAPPCLLLSIAADRYENLLAELAEIDCKSGTADQFHNARIAAGFPWFGVDLGAAKQLPQEISRDQQAISFTKGCYLGQETVARIDALGHVNRHLVGLTWQPEMELKPGSKLHADGKEVGHVTSTSTQNEDRTVGIGLGYVRSEHATAGTTLAADAGPVRVASLPFADV